MTYQYRRRALLAIIFVAAASLAVWVKPVLNRHREIARIRLQNVHVVTVVQRPNWLGRVSVFDWFHDYPICSRVLIEPAGESDLRVLGSQMSFGEAEIGIRELKKTLNARFGTSRIVLVESGSFPPKLFVRLLDMCNKLQTVVTPCGIESFKQPVPGP